MSCKILIVEDEKKISRFLELELEHEGYETDLSFDGRDASEKIESNTYDLIILDVMLPKLNGMEVLRRMRKDGNHTPVIMLTAKDETMDKVMGLDLGADDYMTKPFEIEELLARIRVCLKRKSEQVAEGLKYAYGNLEMDLNKYEVQYNDEKIDLSNKEFELLKFLLANKEIVLPREKILDKVWGYDYYGNTNIIDVYIRYLRSKIDERFDEKLIHTVRGVGYILKHEEE